MLQHITLKDGRYRVNLQLREDKRYAVSYSDGQMDCSSLLELNDQSQSYCLALLTTAGWQLEALGIRYEQYPWVGDAAVQAPVSPLGSQKTYSQISDEAYATATDERSVGELVDILISEALASQQIARAIGDSNANLKATRQLDVLSLIVAKLEES